MWYAMEICYTFHISTIFHIEPPGFRHSTPYTSHIFNTTGRSHKAWLMWIVWCGIWCDVQCLMWDVVPYHKAQSPMTSDIHPNESVAVMWSEARLSDVEHVRYGAMLHVPPCNVRWEMWWCDVAGMVWYMWKMGVCCKDWCEMWLWNTESPCGMVWRSVAPY